VYSALEVTWITVGFISIDLILHHSPNLFSLGARQTSIPDHYVTYFPINANASDWCWASLYKPAIAGVPEQPDTIKKDK